MLQSRYSKFIVIYLFIFDVISSAAPSDSWTADYKYLNDAGIELLEGSRGAQSFIFGLYLNEDEKNKKGLWDAFSTQSYLNRWGKSKVEDVGAFFDWDKLDRLRYSSKLEDKLKYRNVLMGLERELIKKSPSIIFEMSQFGLLNHSDKPINIKDFEKPGFLEKMISHSNELALEIDDDRRVVSALERLLKATNDSSANNFTSHEIRMILEDEELSKKTYFVIEGMGIDGEDIKNALIEAIENTTFTDGEKVKSRMLQNAKKLGACKYAICRTMMCTSPI